MRVLVLGGAGFLGRHVVAALAGRGHVVTIGSRGRPSLPGAEFPVRRARFEDLTTPEAWSPVVDAVDAVVNCVGILRERGRATYERVHHRAPGALAAACALRRLRLVHVSALALLPCARSGFIRSKLSGEAAVRTSGADYTIVRPSLLEGRRRLRRALAAHDVALADSLRPRGRLGSHRRAGRRRRRIRHCPTGRVARNERAGPLPSANYPEARSAEGSPLSYREVELGGLERRTLAGHLAALRTAPRPAYVVRVPALLARVASHVCDVLHLSPFSFGHLELLRRDNVPKPNLLPALLGAPPRRIGGVQG